MPSNAVFVGSGEAYFTSVSGLILWKRGTNVLLSPNSKPSFRKGHPTMAQYIHITYPRKQLHERVDTLKAQFADSDEVSVVDYGISTKQIQAYIVLA